MVSGLISTGGNFLLNLFCSSICKPLLPETSILGKTRLNQLQVRVHFML